MTNRSERPPNVMAQPCGFAGQERRLADSNCWNLLCTCKQQIPAYRGVLNAAAWWVVARSTAAVFAPAVALSFVEGDVLRYLAIILAAASVLLLTTTARAAMQGRPQPALIARISKQVFGPRWKTAACIAHYESTAGASLVNGPNLGPWQINVAAHPWANARRLLTDWWYAARVAFRISRGGRDWSAWSTRGLCGA